MIKEIFYEDEMRNRILTGMEKVADLVAATLGPGGRNTALYKKAELREAKWSDAPTKDSVGIVINDGATIAKSIVLADPVENIGAQIIVEAAQKTNDLAGDGTTTTTVLTRAMVQDGFKMVSAGANPILLQKKLKEIAVVVEDELDRMAEPVESEDKLAAVAAVSSGDEKIGAAVGKALYEVGLEGVIKIEDYAIAKEPSVKIDEGIVLNKGFVNSLMAEDQEKGISELYDPYVLITDYKIENSRQILDLLIEVAEAEGSLVIIAEEVQPEVVATILKTKMEGGMTIVAVQPPLYGEGRRWRMEDMAVQTGASFITKELGRTLQDTHLQDLGRAGYVRVTRKETVLMDAKGDPAEVQKREAYLRSLIKKTDYEFNRKRHEERLALFVSGVATILPGGMSRLETEEQKFKIEDAINAAKAARAEGILPGGGTAFLRCIPAVQTWMEQRKDSDVEEAHFAARMIIKALQAPLLQIAQNCGLDGATVINKVLEAAQGTGFHAGTLEYTDLKQAGVIDPLAVSKLAFRSAVSVAATFLSSGAVVSLSDSGSESEK